ncbi:MAG: DJ-1/PfpI family protein [Zavarzinella sp.]
MRALFLVADEFEDVQFFSVAYRLSEEGYDIVVASNDEEDFVEGENGYILEDFLSLSDVSPSDYSVLVIPGGHSPERLRLWEDAVDITRIFAQEGTPIVAIGHGVQLLISAGTLDGKLVTCSPALRDDVKLAGASYRDEDTVVDGVLITARDTESIPVLNGKLCKLLKSR